MTLQNAFEPAATGAEQADRDANVAHRALDTYPERLFAHDMAAIYRVSLNQFYRLNAAGAFLFAEMRPRVGRMAWSRERVQQHFAGSLTGLTLSRKRA